MIQANVAIDNFYIKCEIVFRGDLSTCDVMMGAFLTQTRETQKPPPRGNGVK